MTQPQTTPTHSKKKGSDQSIDRVESSRPYKRSRKNSVPDEVSLLNENGIYNMQSGREQEAEVCFSRALGRADVFMASISGADSLSSPHMRLAGLGNAAVSHELSEVAASPAKSRMLYMHQRQEYDEGMYFFSDGLPLDKPLTEFSRLATLLYNVAQTHVRRGRYAEARHWFRQALVRLSPSIDLKCKATALLAAKIHHNLGHCGYRMGLNKEASVAFHVAHDIVAAAGLDDDVDAATQNCKAVLLFHSESPGSLSALYMFKASLLTFRRTHGNHSQQVATILNNIGRVHYLDGKYDDALAAYEEALSIRSTLIEVDPIDAAATMCNTGQVLQQKGDLDKAMDYYREFLRIAESRLGSSHRDIAVIFKCIAEIYHSTGDHPKALQLYEKALHSGHLALGNFHPEIASTINKLGNLYYEMQDLETALNYYTQGLKIEQVVLPPCHPHIMVTLMNIAQIHRHRSNFAAALGRYTEVHKLQLEAYGPNNLAAANSLASIGLMHYQLKSYGAAFDVYQEALRIQRDHYDTDDHLEIASTLNSIGLVLFNQGVHGLAKSCFTDSLRIRRLLLGDGHREVAILWYNIATICLESGEDDVAIKLYQETLRVERNALGNRHRDVILTLQHLGLVHQQRGELDEALKYFNEALEIERSKSENCIAVGKLLNLIGNIHLQRASVGKMMTCYTEASRLYLALERRADTLVIAGYNCYGLSRTHPPCASVA